MRSFSKGVVTLGLLAGLLLGAGVRAPAPPAEVVIPPARGAGALSPNERKRVEQSIERGVVYLRGAQLRSGSWSVAGEAAKQPVAGGPNPSSWPVAYAALPALALLESGAAPADAAVQKAARFIRASTPTITKTYEISLALLFLDRLGEREDAPVIRSLALRLIAGQMRFGGWDYNCPVLTPAQEKKVVDAVGELQANYAEQLEADVPKLKKGINIIRGDNSNTQFAVLGLWIARKQDLPLEYTFARVEQRFRLSQSPTGWHYGYGRANGYGSMTCVGLLGLAIGRASPAEPKDGGNGAKPEDKRIAAGLRALAHHLKDASDTASSAKSPAYGPQGTLNLYFLWSVERVGVLLNLKTIGGKDWYRWGAELLLRTQQRDGSWLGRGNGGSPVIDTSMALLFLKKSDLLPDLRETLQKRLTITDPGLDRGVSPKKSPGDKTDLKKGIDKKDPKTDLKTGIDKKNPGDKTGSMKEPDDDGPLVANLGEVKARQATKLPLRVRGPSAFKITGIRGADARLKIAVPSQKKSREVHELTLTLYPGKAGPFERTITLATDIPGRAEVTIEIRAAAR